ncbi:hypothetical protein M9458_009133, partial [Cirrhinus mrigala]
MRHDLYEEKRKDITNATHHNRVNILVPFDTNGTLITRYLLVGKKDDDTTAQDTTFTEGSDAIIQSTVRDVEFVDGFQRVSPTESYLFLNTVTDYERKVLVLRMNSSKEKKRDIIRSLQAATIKCCNDKVRPVLAASTVIPSGKRVIWAGAFSAQNQQDPENSALALISALMVKSHVVL